MSGSVQECDHTLDLLLGHDFTVLLWMCLMLPFQTTLVFDMPVFCHPFKPCVLVQPYRVINSSSDALAWPLLSYTIAFNSSLHSLLQLGFSPHWHGFLRQNFNWANQPTEGVLNNDVDFLCCFSLACSLAMTVEEENEAIQSVDNISRLNLIYSNLVQRGTSLFPAGDGCLQCMQILVSFLIVLGGILVCTEYCF